MGTPRPRALWVIPVGEVGGVARHVCDVAEVGLPGWDLAVLCPEGPLAERLREYTEVRVIAGDFGPDAGFRASVVALKRAIAQTSPAVVHSHLAYADIVAACATLGTRIRLATTEHGIAGDDGVYHGAAWKAHLMAAAHRMRFWVTDVAIAVSQATKDTMVAKWNVRRHVQIIHNGVDMLAVSDRVQKYRAVPSHGPRILSLARLSPEKRIPKLLEAFSMVLREHPGASLTVAGLGPEGENLRALARSLGVDDRVRFPGFLDADAAMADADVVVQLSVWENCSYTLLDAVAAGLGVVATPVGGNPEILPPECLADASRPADVASAIARQAERGQRPTLDPDWPTRQRMAHQIARAYVDSQPW